MNERIVKVVDLIVSNANQLPILDANKIAPDFFYKEYVKKQRPVIIKGGLNWPALKLWEKVGHMELLFEHVKANGTEMYNPVPFLHQVVSKKVLVSDYIKIMRNSAGTKTYSIPSLSFQPEWDSEFGVYTFFDKQYVKTPLVYPQKRLFIYKNASTEWHYHVADETLTTQILGKKRVSLFRTSLANHKIVKDILESNFHHMDMRQNFFSFEPKINSYEGFIDAGDTLYIPPFWYHGIDTADANVGATLAYCFRSPVDKVMSFKEPILIELLVSIIKHIPIYVMPLFLLKILFYTSVSTLRRRLGKGKWRE